MAKVYIRKMMKHDITHEVSLTAYVFYEFFLGADSVYFQIEGEGIGYEVTFNNATDLRFGGEFKALCRKIGAQEGDFLLMTENNCHHFSISIEKSYQAFKSLYYPFFTGNRRHLIAVVENGCITKQYVR